MKSVQEIQSEIAELTPEEIRQVAEWLAEYQEELWDKQIQEDAAAGRLDQYIEEALDEQRRGETRRFP